MVEYRRCIAFYRQIQILERILNKLLNFLIIPAVISFTPMAEIVTMYVSFTLYKEIPMPGFVLFPLLMVDVTVINVLTFMLAGWVNSTSKQVLGEYARDPQPFGRRHELTRTIKSCSHLSIKFGSNFVDEGTSLVIQNFCLNQASSLILIRKND